VLEVYHSGYVYGVVEEEYHDEDGEVEEYG
jgi:hypothetical protein